MDMTGEYRIAAPREAVWMALNDPDVLRKCIPGCESVTKLSETEMMAEASVALGPVKARFKGKITLADVVPPESYTLSGEGQGGAAGFAKGEARVKLTPDGQATLMSYAVKANIGGRLAQMGQRLIDGAAKKMADDFFQKFAVEAAGDDAATPPRLEAAMAPTAQHPTVISPPIWIPIAIVALCALAVMISLVR